MLEKVKQRYMNMKIRNKLSIMIISLVCILMVLILYVSNKILYNSVIDKTRQSIEEDCELIGTHLEVMYDNLVTCSNILTKDINKVYRDIGIANTDEISFVSVKNNLYTALDYERRIFKDIDFVVFMDVNQNIVYSGIAHEPDKEKIAEQLIKNMEETGPPVCRFFEIQNRPYLTDTAENPILTVGKRIISMDTGVTIGYLFMSVKESMISSVFPSEEGKSYERNYYILDETGKIVSSPDKNMIQQFFETDQVPGDSWGRTGDNFQTHIETNDYLITRQEIPSMGWMLASKISINDLTKDIRVTSSVIVIIGIICLLAAIILIFILSEFITKPIRNLTYAAKKIQTGDFDTYCEVLSTDEVGHLSEAFNEMTRQVSNLLIRVQMEQKQKQEFELALVQTQIKPHFLYNTLDLIYVFCDMNDAAGGARITKALAEFYRTNLSKGREIITIREELKNIENYLLIQKERYYDIIEYRIDVDDRILPFSILKMTLQPIIENAVYHGLKEKGTEGCIMITGRLEEDMILLEVADNGVGMEESQITDILHKESRLSEKHFGLRNVHERIQLYFGEKYGVVIDSKKGEGTRIRINIPKRTEEYHA